MGSPYWGATYDLLQVSMCGYPMSLSVHTFTHSFMFSSLLALHGHYEACRCGHARWDEQSLAAVEAARAKIIERCRDLLSEPGSSLESISPFFLHCIYMVAIFGQSKPQTTTATGDVLVDTLRHLERRWHAAGESGVPWMYCRVSTKC